MTWVTFKQLISFIKPHWVWVMLNVTATLSSAIIDVLGGYFIQTVTDAALNNQVQVIVQTIYLIILTTGIGIVVKYGLKYTSGQFTALALKDIRRQTTEHIVKLPFFYVEAQHSGDIVSRLTNDAAVIQKFFQDNLSNLIYQPLVLIAALAYMWTLSWPLLLVVAAVVPLTIFLTHWLGKPLSRYAKEEQEGFAGMNSVAQDTLSGIHMNKAFNLEQVLYDKFAGAVNQILDNRLRFEKRLAFMTPLFIIIRVLPILTAAGYGGYLAVVGQMTPGSLFAFIYLLGFLNEPLIVMPQLLIDLRSATAAADRILEVIDYPAERTDGYSFSADPAQAIIESRDVAFAYNEGLPILSGVTFAVPSGKTVALVGHSGSGKSTIFKLLCGFYPTQAGQLKLYGRDFKRWSLEAIRRQFALVAQDTYLFPGTVTENIAYGRPQASTAEIIKAAKTANAHQFIVKLSDGYDTVVGERGNRLSGGQRQRIAIARAVLKDAPILLLDEPTSALDAHSEALVQEALDRFMMGRTVLVIAHRLSTIKQADLILVLDQGCIVEQGSHRALMAANGLYQQLYQKQFQPQETVEAERTDHAL